MAISPEDQEEMIREINKSYNSISPLIRGFVPPVPTLLKQIPACARKYTLGEVIDFLTSAHNTGKIP
ncbi:MAG: hypothetical protein KAW09_02680 [Thermoplasmata archaeon]|nr:hypothetical protein [Thermoplasmata archaeon]